MNLICTYKHKLMRCFQRLKNAYYRAEYMASLKYKEIKDRRNFYVEAPMNAAGNLLRKTPITEKEYLAIDIIEPKNAKIYYVYSIINETIKASSSAMRWKELLSSSEKLNISDEDQVCRVVDESVVDEQNMWLRKLTEILVDEIIFSKYNSENYYLGYLSAIELDDMLGMQNDIKEFYNCQNNSVDMRIRKCIKIICEMQDKTGKRPLPFLKSTFTDRTQPYPGQVLKSFRSRLSEVLMIASDEEKLAFKGTYGIGYGSWSKSLHGKVSGPIQNLDIKTVDVQLGHVAVLCFNIIHRAHQLLSIDASEINKQIENYFKYSSNAPELMNSHRRDHEKGDIVIINRSLGQILDEIHSKYGYKSYKIEYLDHIKSRSILTDWFPAIDVVRIARKTKAREFWEKELAKTEQGRKIWEQIKGKEDEKLFEMMKSLLIDFSNRNVLIQLLMMSSKGRS